MTEHRYPLDALIRASGLSYDNARRGVGASGQDWIRAASDGLLEAKADRWAVRLGRLPFDVWPDWFDDALRACHAAGCSNRFAPYRDQDLYCSRTCARRERIRRYRATPGGRAKNAEACRRYKADVAASRARRAALAVVVVVALAGCSASVTSTPSTTPAVVPVKLPNGKTVTCIDFGEWGSCDLLGFTSGAR